MNTTSDSKSQLVLKQRSHDQILQLWREFLYFWTHPFGHVTDTYIRSDYFRRDGKTNVWHSGCFHCKRPGHYEVVSNLSPQLKNLEVR